MKEIFKLSGILFLVTAVAATALSSINSITRPRIGIQRQREAERALAVALPTADMTAVSPVMRGEELLYYRGYASSDMANLVGYAVVARGEGYSSTIETMVGVDTSFVITGVKVLFQQETPGLGTKMMEVKQGQTSPWFQDQFGGRNTGSMAVDKDGGEIVSIIGATISSRALTNSIVAAVDSLRRWTNQNPETGPGAFLDEERL